MSHTTTIDGAYTPRPGDVLTKGGLEIRVDLVDDAAVCYRRFVADEPDDAEAFLGAWSMAPGNFVTGAQGAKLTRSEA